MDILTLYLAAKKAEQNLAESGKIASTSVNYRSETHKYTFVPNDDFGGLCAVMIDGTLGVKPSDFDLRFIWNSLELRVPFDGQNIIFGNYDLAGLEVTNPDLHISSGSFLLVIDFMQNTTMVIAKNPGEHSFAMISHYEKIVPIDQKYIPPLDSLILNGADGQQYVVSVDEGGSLVVLPK